MALTWCNCSPAVPQVVDCSSGGRFRLISSRQFFKNYEDPQGAVRFFHEPASLQAQEEDWTPAAASATPPENQGRYTTRSMRRSGVKAARVSQQSPAPEEAALDLDLASALGRGTRDTAAEAFLLDNAASQPQMEVQQPGIEAVVTPQLVLAEVGIDEDMLGSEQLAVVEVGPIATESQCIQSMDLEPQHLQILELPRSQSQGFAQEGAVLLATQQSQEVQSQPQLILHDVTPQAQLPQPQQQQQQQLETNCASQPEGGEMRDALESPTKLSLQCGEPLKAQACEDSHKQGSPEPRSASAAAQGVREPRHMLKLKDWPPESEFSQVMARHNQVGRVMISSTDSLTTLSPIGICSTRIHLLGYEAQDLRAALVNF